MERQGEIPREVFDQIVAGAIEDLRKCGLENEEIFAIIEEKFGSQFARKFCPEAQREKDSHIL